MANGVEVFKARLTATDEVTPVFQSIQQQAKALGHQIEELGHKQQHLEALQKKATALGHEIKEVGHKQEHLEHPSIWAHMREHTSEAGKQWGELGEHVKSVHEKISELLPAIGALGAAGSAVALVENTEHMAEAYGQLGHSAEALGLSTQALYRWNTVAKLTDTNSESLAKSMNRLNVDLDKVHRHKDKDMSSLFNFMHVDASKLHSAGDALPAIADAFKRIEDPAKRADMAAKLFGARTGVEMIPLLSKGGDAIREYMREADRIAPNFAEIGPALEHYNESMKRMGVATEAFRYVVAGALAPALEPVIEGVTEWTVANREWIATGIKDEMHELGTWVKAVDWTSVGQEVGVWEHRAEGFVEAVGGAKTLVEGLAGVMALKGVFFLGKEIGQTVVLGVQLIETVAKLGLVAAGWVGVGAAAEGAAAAEEAAAVAGGGKAGLAAKFLPAGAAAIGATAVAGAAAAGSLYLAYKTNKPAYDNWRSAVHTREDMADNDSAVRLRYANASPAWRAQFDALEARRGGHVIRPEDREAAREREAINGMTQAPAAMTPPPSTAAGGAAKVDGHVGVTVNISGAPPGSTASAKSTGAAAGATVNVNQAFYDVH